MPDKSSPLDVIPTSNLKAHAQALAPAIVNLANISFKSNCFQLYYKVAQIKPLIKKTDLDPKVPSNYRPISNLHKISKVLERIVLSRLQPHLLKSTNISKYQLAYRGAFD